MKYLGKFFLLAYDLLTYSKLLQLVQLTGYDSIFSEYLLTTILLRNTVPSLQVSWGN